MIDDAYQTSPDRGCAPGKADPNLFFAERAPQRSGKGAQIVARVRREQARAQCRRFCPFTVQCFAWAEESGQGHGFWGGVDMSSELDRRKHRELWGIATVTTTPVPPPVEAPVAAVPVDEVEETLDEQVAELYEQGKDDGAIAMTIGVHPKTVSASRARQHLPALYGPGGRHLTDAGRAHRAKRFEQQDRIVRDLHKQGLNDASIADQAELTLHQVRWIRGTRLGLVANRVVDPERAAQIERENTRVRELYDLDLTDPEIGERLGLNTRQVFYIRARRLQLPAKFGPGGLRIDGARQAVPA